MVYIQPSEKVPKFSGNPETADSPTLEEWIEIIENHVQLKPTEKEKATWVYNHLEGVARREVKYLPKHEMEAVNGIFKILMNNDELISLQRRFFNHKQHEEEPLLDYSQALMSVMNQIVEADEQAKPKSQKELRDQFCEGVRDHKMGELVVPSLLDTGSMVTTITRSFFRKHFGHLTDAPLRDCAWLDLRAGNGLELPYLGYLELDHYTGKMESWW